MATLTVDCCRLPALRVARILAACLLAAPLWTLMAQATPRSGEAIIRSMHDRYAQSWYHTLSFTQQTLLRSRADTMVAETWKEVGMLPGYLRVDMQRATGTITGIYAGDSLFFVKGDSTLNRVATRNILLIMGFDVYRQPADKTLSILHDEHYAMTPVREDSWDGRPVYVIGAAAGDLHSHQLWIDKDRLLFLRALEPSSRDSTKAIDYRFMGYVAVPGGWIAERVETYVDGKLVQSEKYSDVRTNIPVDPQIFVPPGRR